MISSRKEGKFTVKKITKFSDLKEGSNIELPESDLCFQNDDLIIQMSYQDPPDRVKKVEIKPGVMVLGYSSGGVVVTTLELRNRDRILESVSNTSRILGEARNFFNKLHIYDLLERPKKRSVLLYSSPGMGKTSAIEKFCSESMSEDPGTVVIVWPTSEVDADSVFSFLSTKIIYNEKCSKMILIIEDIGGREGEASDRRSDVDSGLLNLLDGVGLTFRLPTFIIATTNFPENLLESLADRPGRFDLMMEFKSPSLAEKISIVEFIAKRSLSPEEKTALGTKEAAQFSIAHLEEVVVRSLLHDKTIEEVIKELASHSARVKNSFEDKRSLGL